MFGVYGQGLGTVARRQNSVTIRFKRPLRNFQKGSLIVHDQDHLAVADCQPCQGFIGWLYLDGGGRGDIYSEFRPLPNFAVNIDESAVAFDDSSDAREPEARSFALLLSGKKRLIYFFYDFGRHAGAGIGNSDDDVAALLCLK